MSFAKKISFKIAIGQYVSGRFIIVGNIQKTANKLIIFMSTQFSVQLSHISKKYEIHHEKPTLVEKFIKSTGKSNNESFLALNDINLNIKKGERVGIIGPNGSGKTTLLKIISGITSPTFGKAMTNGKVVSLIDLEAGFHEDLTGEQNIYLNGMLLGMKNEEINRNKDKIIRFANIGQFIDTPLFTYSSGMTLRLGFAIAVHADPDVLLLDEGMSIGDTYFHNKAISKIKDFFRAGKTIIVVSHWLDFIKTNCSIAYTLDKGRIIRSGKPDAVIKAYLNNNL